MNTNQVITLARKHLGKGTMEGSARVCLADALKAHDEGDLTTAKDRALKSLRYSIGILHADYKRASK